MNFLTFRYILILIILSQFILPKIDIAQFPMLNKLPPQEVKIDELENTKNEAIKKQLLRKIRRAIRKTYKADKNVANLKKALDEYTKIKTALDIKTNTQTQTAKSLR